MAQRMREASLPWPYTWSFPTLENLLTRHDLLPTLPFPLIIKSYYSHRGDLVGKVDNIEGIQALAAQWSQEPVVLQEFAAGDGWDIKLWVIGQQIFAARRRTPLEPNAAKEDYPIAPEELPAHDPGTVLVLNPNYLNEIDRWLDRHGSRAAVVNLMQAG